MTAEVLKVNQTQAIKLGRHWIYRLPRIRLKWIQINILCSVRRRGLISNKNSLMEKCPELISNRAVRMNQHSNQRLDCTKVKTLRLKYLILGRRNSRDLVLWNEDHLGFLLEIMQLKVSELIQLEQSILSIWVFLNKQ